MYKRILLKLSGEVLAGKSLNCFNDDIIKRIVNEIGTVANNGTEVSLVVGGGNFWRGRSANSEMDRVKADEIGMLATVMNAIYLEEAFRIEGYKAVVMTTFAVGNMTIHYRRDLALEYLKNEYIVIFAGGTGHPFFSTDSIAALRSAELCCDCILYAKNIDGIYDKDPNLNNNAKKYQNITYDQIIKDDLHAIDISAISISKQQNIPSIAFDLRVENSIVIAGNKDDDKLFKIGTKINVN